MKSCPHSPWILSLFCCLGSLTTSHAALNSETRGELSKVARQGWTLNTVKLHHLGRTSKPLRMKLLKEAQSHIMITVPYWFDDPEGREFFGAVKDKLNRQPDFDFRVMMDWSTPGSTGDFWGTKLFQDLKGLTRDQVLLWNTPYLAREYSLDIMRNRLHEKLFVVDGKKLLMGGMNIADDYLKGGIDRKGWHDTDVLIEGPAAQQAQNYIIRKWEATRYLENPMNYFPTFPQSLVIETFKNMFEDEDGSFVVRAPFGLGKRKIELPIAKYDNSRYFPPLENTQPGQVPVLLLMDNPITDQDPVSGSRSSKTLKVLTQLLEKAKKNVRIFIPYGTLSKPFQNALEKCARRGVAVELITNSLKSHDLGKFAYFGSVGGYPSLMKAGIKIHEWQGHADFLELEKKNNCEVKDYWPGRTLHTKAIMIDHEITVIGSNNMNVRSDFFNSESMAVIDDEKFTSELNDVFEYDLDHGSDPKTVQCGDKFLPRPRRTEQLDPAKVDQAINQNNLEVILLGKLRIYM